MLKTMRSVENYRRMLIEHGYDPNDPQWAKEIRRYAVLRHEQKVAEQKLMLEQLHKAGKKAPKDEKVTSEERERRNAICKKCSEHVRGGGCRSCKRCRKMRSSVEYHCPLLKW